MVVNHYDKTFKEQAVKLSKHRGNIKKVARQLGISGSQHTKWRKDFNIYGEKTFPCRGNERLTEVERENKELKKRSKRHIFRCLEIKKKQ